MSALRHLWNIPDPIDIFKDSQIKAMLGIFGKDHERFKANIDSRNFGEELFEFDMASNRIKRFERGWEWEDFKGCVGSYQRFGLDPFENHIPNAVAFTHDSNFYNPDYSVLYWKRTPNGYQLRNKLVEVKGTRNLKNQDYEIYQEYQRKIIDPHNDKVRKYAKDHFVPKCLVEFELFVYPDAYATGLKAERDGQDWNPTVHHLEKLEIYDMEELEAIWNATPRTDHEDQYMKVKTRSIFDPNKVNTIEGIDDWSDDHYKKPIRRSVLENRF